MDRRFEKVGARFDLLEQQIVAAKFEVIGPLRGDPVMHTRTMVFTMAGTVAALGGLAIALSRL